MEPVNENAPLGFVEVVLVAEDCAATIAATVRCVHEQLLETPPAGRWSLTVLDNGSTDTTFAAARLVAATLAATGAARLAVRHSRLALRETWSGEAAEAEQVVFVRADRAAGMSGALVELRRHLSGHGVAGIERLTLFERVMGRRRAVTTLGGIGLAALVAACSSSRSTPAAPASPTAGTSAAASAASPASTTVPASTATSTAAPSTTVAAEDIACVLSPEMTEGPFFLDLDLLRADITEGRAGSPLALTLRVVDVASCTPIADAFVDVWHSDAAGVYSGFGPGRGNTFLRGQQVTDRSGRVSFRTVYPGWYPGRAVHIHLKVRVGGRDVHTGQLFFDEAFTDQVYASAPYDQRRSGRTFNSEDNIFASGGARSMLSVAGSPAGYTATPLVLGVQSA